MEINCCIVDDHCDIIPFLQCCWRSKRIPFSGLIFVHFDAHADLSIYDTNKVENFDDMAVINNLMDQEGGISEFILPLVILNHFSQICWIYPDVPIGNENYPDLIGNKKHLFWIGNSESNSIGVSGENSYYLEDGVVYDAQELSSCCLVNILVCNSSSTLALVHKILPTNLSIHPSLNICDSKKLSPKNKTSTPWILDICLDYFSVYNPFLIPLIEDLSKNHPPVEVQGLLQTILLMLRHPDFRISNHQDISTQDNFCNSELFSDSFLSNRNLATNLKTISSESARKRLERLLFLEALTLLCNCACSTSPCNCEWYHTCSSQIFSSNNDTTTTTNENKTLQNSSCECTSILCRKVIYNKIINKSSTSNPHIINRMELETRFISLFTPLSSKEIAQNFLTILPTLSTISRDLIANSNFLLLLPHYPRAMEGPDGIQEMVKKLITFCQRLDMGLPVAITIAKSLGLNEFNHNDDDDDDISNCNNNNNNNNNNNKSGIKLPGAYTPLHQADHILSLLLSALTSWIQSYCTETSNNSSTGRPNATSGINGSFSSSFQSSSELVINGCPASLLRPLPASFFCLDFVGQITKETSVNSNTDNSNNIIDNINKSHNPVQSPSSYNNTTTITTVYHITENNTTLQNIPLSSSTGSGDITSGLLPSTNNKSFTKLLIHDFSTSEDVRAAAEEVLLYKRKRTCR